MVCVYLTFLHRGEIVTINFPNADVLNFTINNNTDYTPEMQKYTEGCYIYRALRNVLILFAVFIVSVITIALTVISPEKEKKQQQMYGHWALNFCSFVLFYF